MTVVNSLRTDPDPRAAASRATVAGARPGCSAAVGGPRRRQGAGRRHAFPRRRFPPRRTPVSSIPTAFASVPGRAAQNRRRCCDDDRLNRGGVGPGRHGLVRPANGAGAMQMGDRNVGSGVCPDMWARGRVKRVGPSPERGGRSVRPVTARRRRKDRASDASARDLLVTTSRTQIRVFAHRAPIAHTYALGRQRRVRVVDVSLPSIYTLFVPNG
jgi:hypothetical protein